VSVLRVEAVVVVAAAAAEKLDYPMIVIIKVFGLGGLDGRTTDSMTNLNGCFRE
jgi:hypothetical protein